MTNPPRGIYNTAICIRCLRRKATRHTGHVTVGRRKITAGWCARCLRALNSGRLDGWLGYWRPEMNPRCGDKHDPGDGVTTCIRDPGHKGRHTDGGDAWSNP